MGDDSKFPGVHSHLHRRILTQEYWEDLMKMVGLTRKSGSGLEIQEVQMIKSRGMWFQAFQGLA